MDDETDEPGMTVAQTAAAVGVTAHTLRYYEQAGLIPPVARDSGNRRRYDEADVAWLRFLLRLRETGMPVARMREYARLRAQGPATVGPRLALLEAHQAVVREQVARLRRHEKALALKIATYRDDLAAQRGPDQPTRPEKGAARG